MGIINKSASRTLGIAAALSAAMLACTAWADLTPPSYRYYRFKVEATKDPGVAMMQLSEFKLYNGTDVVTSNATLSYDDTTKTSGEENYPAAESPDKAIDGDTATKWLDKRCNVNELQSVRDAVWIAFDFGAPQAITKYEWYTANDETGRNPASWRFQGSDDGTIWTDIDKQVRYQSTDSFFQLGYQCEYAAFDVRPRFIPFTGGVLRDLLHLGSAQNVNPPSSLGGIATDILDYIGDRKSVV